MNERVIRSTYALGMALLNLAWRWRGLRCTEWTFKLEPRR